MSRSGVLCLALAATALSADLHGQSTAEYRRRVQDLLLRLPRVDSLMRVQAAARRARIALDTVRAGDLLLLAIPARRARVQQLSDRAWPIIANTFGGQTAVLRRHIFVVSFDGDGWTQVEESSIPVGVADSGTAADLVRGAASALYQAMDTTLRAWLEEPYVPRDVQRAHVEALYVELVTSPWHEVQMCYAGEISACRFALGIAGREDPWSQWYDAGDRRRLVERSFQGSPRLGECVTDHDDAACLAGLRFQSRDLTQTPFSRAARRNLLAAALLAGGSGAYERLVSTDGDLEQRLERAAGTSTDSLVVDWRDRILSAHPKTLDFEPESAWTAVVWCLVLAAVALRSSRWR